MTWKYRLSQKQHEEATMTRPKKMARLDTLTLHEALIDDIPSRDIPTQLGANQLRQMLNLFSISLALCQGVHLGTLKLYERKFMLLATARFEVETSLRPPNAQECMIADQRVWGKIFDLVNLKGWDLDDAIHEFVEIRSDLDALLQPRPSAPRPSKGIGKASAPSVSSKGKKGKGKTFGKSKSDWVTECTKDNRKHTICLRFNMGQCTDTECRYSHVCSIKKPNGSACAGNHAAIRHVDAPH